MRAASDLSHDARKERSVTSHVPPPPLAAQFCMIMPKAAGNLSGAIEGKGLTGKMKVEIARRSLGDRWEIARRALGDI